MPYLQIEISTDLHSRLKSEAALTRKSLKAYAAEKLAEKRSKSRAPKARPIADPRGLNKKRRS